MRAAENDTVVYSVCSTVGGTLTLEPVAGDAGADVRDVLTNALQREDPSCVRRVAVDSASPSVLRLMKNVFPISFGWLLTRCVSRSLANPSALTYAPAGPYSFV